MNNEIIKSTVCLARKEKDHIYISDRSKQVIEFYKDKIVASIVTKEGDRKLEASYNEIEAIKYSKKNALCIMIKNPNSTNNFKRMILAFYMEPDGYNRLLSEIDSISPGFIDLKKKIEIKYFFKYDLIWIILGIILVVFIFSQITPKGTSEWDKLDNSQKEWYKRNYGNGQYEKYQNSIKNYKKNN